MNTLFEDFYRDVNVKKFRIRGSKFGILFLTNISLALLRQETCKILPHRSL